MYCFISGCPNSNDSSKDSKKARMVQIFFSAPEDESLFKQWQSSVPKNNGTFSRNDKLCDFHFKKSEVVLFNETKLPNGNVRRLPALEPKLKAGTIPSIFPEVKEAPKKVINAEVQKTTLKRKLSSCDESDIPNPSPRTRGRPRRNTPAENEKSTPTPPVSQRSKKKVTDSDSVVALEERLFKEIGSDDESSEELAAGMQPSIRLVPLEVLLATSQSKRKGTKSTAAPKSVLESRKRKAALLAQTADTDKIIKKSKSEQPMKDVQQKTLSKPMESRTKERANMEQICSELELMAGEISDENDVYEIERITDPGSTQDDLQIFEIMSIKSDPDYLDQKKSLEELAAELADSGDPDILDSISTDSLDTTDSKPIGEPKITEVISLQGLEDEGNILTDEKNLISDEGNLISDKGKKVDNIEMEMAKMLGESGQSEAPSNQEKAVLKFRSLETDKKSLMKDLTTGELPESKSNSGLDIDLPEINEDVGIIGTKSDLPEEGISKDSVVESPSKETENIIKSKETLSNEDTSEINSLKDIGEDPQLLKEGESEQCALKETITEPQLSKESESDQITLKDSLSETQIPKESVSEQNVKKDSVYEPQLSKEGESDQSTSKDSLSETQLPKESESEQYVSENNTSGPKLSKESEFDQNVSKESAPELHTSKVSKSEQSTSKDSEREVPLSKGSDCEKSTSKDSKTEVSLPNESESERSSSKDGKTEIPLLKETESEQSTSKDNESEQSTSKDNESEQSTSKDNESEQSTSKDNESEMSTLKDNECEQSISKDNESEVPLSKDSESEQSTSKDNETEVPLPKENESEQSSLKKAETEVTPAKQSESEHSISKESETEVLLSKESESEQSTSKDSETAEVPLSKESESEQSTSKDSETEVPLSKESESEQSTSKDSETEVPLSKESESEQSISKDSETEVPLSKDSESEQSTTKYSITEPQLDKDTESEQISSNDSVMESQIAKNSDSEEDASKENESEMNIVIESITGSQILIEGEFETSENDNAEEPILNEDAIRSTDSTDTSETLSKKIDPKLPETKTQKSSGFRRVVEKKFDGLVSSDDEIIGSPEHVLNISSDSEADPTWAPNADAIEVSDANDTDPDSDNDDESDTEKRSSNSNKGSKANINNQSKVGSKPSSNIVAPAEVSKLLTQDALQQILRKLKLPLEQPVSFHIADDATVGIARSIASPKHKAKAIPPRGKVVEAKKQNENTPTYKPRPSRRAQISAEKSKKCTKLLGLRMFEGLGKIKKALDFSTFLTDDDDELQYKKFCLILKECLKDVCESKNAVTNIGKLTLILSNKTIKNILPIPDLEPIQQPKQTAKPSPNNKREVHQENLDEAEMLECMTVDSNVENHLNAPSVENAMEEEAA